VGIVIAVAIAKRRPASQELAPPPAVAAEPAPVATGPSAPPSGGIAVEHPPTPAEARGEERG
jgi:hypothetical protein